MRIEKNIRSLLLMIIVLLVTHTIQAQTGKIEGVITDSKTGETLVGANVVILGTTTGVIADLDGHYVLTNLKPGTYKLQISFISYNSRQIENVRVENGKTQTMDIKLDEVSVTLNNVEVVAVRRTNSEMSMINAIKSNPLVASGISSQQIQKSQDKDASEVVKRIPGITIIEDRFIVVRGLSQRYNNVWLNNAATPSSESDIKAFSFDVIPSSVMDNLMIYKSTAPEIPADFAGGFVKIFTKNLPDENSYQLSYSTSISAGSTFHDFYKFDGGKYEMLGFGDGSRSLPDYFPSSLQNVSNTDQIALSKSLNTDWKARKVKGMPDQKVTFGMTHRFKIGKATIGETTNINYSFSQDYNNTVNRNYGVYDFINHKSGVDYDFQDSVYNQAVKIGILNNWAWLINSKNKIEFRNLYNHQGKYRTTFRHGKEYYSDNTIWSLENGYSGRSTYAGQISGNHQLNSEKTKIEWIGGYALAHKDEPDMKRAKLILNETTGDSNYGNYFLSIPVSPLSSNAGRLFMDMQEKIYSVAFNIDQKINLGSIQSDLKAGIYVEDKTRQFHARKLGYVYSNRSTMDNALQYLPLDELLSGLYFNATTGIKLAEETSKSDSYDAGNKLYAAYFAINLPLSKRLNVYTGLRAEKDKLTLNSYDRYQQPISVVNDTLNLFWSLNISYNISEKSLIRFAYGNSINRPEFREVAPFPFYDFENNAIYSGNESLKNAYIQNYDLRYEFYPSMGETFSFGLFYKSFVDPIEIKYKYTGSGLEYTYQNADKANNYGMEMEFRKSLAKAGLLKNISLMLNGSLIHSKISFDNKTTDLDRPMAGQSPYVINAGLYYDESAKSRLMVSLLYNVIGKRISIVGIPNQHSWENIPDIYEMPRHLVDLTISKKLGKYLEIKGGIKDLLNQPVLFQQTIDTNVDLSYYNGGESQIEHVVAKQVIKKYRPGSYYTLGVSVKF